VSASAVQQKAEPEFQRNEWLEVLLRIRESQPRRYAREISFGLQVRVERYAEARKGATESRGAS
jgi:hypothetical protein